MEGTENKKLISEMEARLSDSRAWLDRSLREASEARQQITAFESALRALKGKHIGVPQQDVVLSYLRQHADRAHRPVEISRGTGLSGGSVQVALTRLLKKSAPVISFHNGTYMYTESLE